MAMRSACCMCLSTLYTLYHPLSYSISSCTLNICFQFDFIQRKQQNKLKSEQKDQPVAIVVPFSPHFSLFIILSGSFLVCLAYRHIFQTKFLLFFFLTIFCVSFYSIFLEILNAPHACMRCSIVYFLWNKIKNRTQGKSLDQGIRSMKEK